MKRKGQKRISADVLLTSADLRRLEKNIENDIRLRDAANARIAENRKVLEAANLIVSLTKKARKAPAKGAAPKSPKSKAAMAALAKELEIKTPPPPAAPSRLPRGGGSYTIVKEVLRAHQQGLPAPEVQRKAAEHPDAPVSIKQHKHYIYSVLDILSKRGEVTKEGGKWKIAAPQVPERAGVH